jgi:OmpA-OmpF porin, OOP family
MKIEIHGHTDSIGSENYNLYLSRKRARSVIAFLTEQGIDSRRLTFEAFGYSKPIESNRSNAGRAKNRRVEFKILNVD